MKKKVLLMGPQRSGKTSMRSMIFANYMPRDIERLMLTHEIDRSEVTFLGNLTLHLWDCGGQVGFIDNYLQKQRAAIFGNVAVLIYVMDIEVLSKNLSENGWNKEKVMQNFTDTASALKQFSPDARLFCLLHKVDLIANNERDVTVQERKLEIAASSSGQDAFVFATSIMNTSLYSAWSTILSTLVPKASLLKHHVRSLLTACDADVAALFDRTTFLCIASAATGDDAEEKVTKVSVLVKAFKMAYAKDNSAFLSMELRDPAFVGMIEGFTNNTTLMILSKDVENISVPLLRTNMRHFAVQFQEYLAASPEAATMKDTL